MAGDATTQAWSLSCTTLAYALLIAFGHSRSGRGHIVLRVVVSDVAARLCSAAVGGLSATRPLQRRLGGLPLRRSVAALPPLATATAPTSPVPDLKPQITSTTTKEAQSDTAACRPLCISHVLHNDKIVIPRPGNKVLTCVALGTRSPSGGCKWPRRSAGRASSHASCAALAVSDLQGFSSTTDSPPRRSNPRPGPQTKERHHPLQNDINVAVPHHL